ncbi:MAG: S16 family serine protease [archaeon]
MRVMLLFALVVLAFPVSAKESHVRLLAVTETPQGYEGSVADLYLFIKPGSGRVFIDTFPITKVDTQMSTRFAKEIACAALKVDCSRNDFFYMIRAESSIIGGPSAGAAIAALTYATLAGQDIKEGVSVTGTINSGGVVGSVSGVKAKIDAAHRSGLKKVLVPFGASAREGNSSDYLADYGRELGMEVVEVSDLSEVMLHFTGLPLPGRPGSIEINPTYLKTMEDISVILCNRTANLIGRLEGLSVNESMLNDTLNLSMRGTEAFAAGHYYSSASYCFGANVKLQYLLISARSGGDDIYGSINQTVEMIAKFKKALDGQRLNTIMDLQAKMVVRERLGEAEDLVNGAIQNLMNNRSDAARYDLAYAYERLYSAKAWSNFFGKPGKGFDLNSDALKRSCMTKIAEAESRVRYVQLFFPGVLSRTGQSISQAGEYYDDADYELCLFKASKAKAESESVITVFGMHPDDYNVTITHKLDMARRVILDQQENSIFPVLGYSYYEYAGSLKDSDPGSSLFYSEYALELSNLDLYFNSYQRPYRLQIEEPVLYAALAGLALGTLLGMMLWRRKGTICVRIK